MISRNDCIRESAYFIWLGRGCPNGCDIEIWDEACRLYDLADMMGRASGRELAKRPDVKALAHGRPVPKKARTPWAPKAAPAKAPARKKPAAKKAAKIIPIAGARAKAMASAVPKTKTKIKVAARK